jgi:hypothetical protein
MYILSCGQCPPLFSDLGWAGSCPATILMYICQL